MPKGFSPNPMLLSWVAADAAARPNAERDRIEAMHGEAYEADPEAYARMICGEWADEAIEQMRRFPDRKEPGA